MSNSNSQRYLCSMGSNIEPIYNFSRAKSYLAGVAKRIHYSASITTDPVDIDTTHQFLNALFVIETHLSAERLKSAFNSIECSLGRDRDDPLSSKKDRPMDIDILGLVTVDETWQAVPDYLQQLTNDLNEFKQAPSATQQLA